MLTDTVWIATVYDAADFNRVVRRVGFYDRHEAGLWAERTAEQIASASRAAGDTIVDFRFDVSPLEMAHTRRSLQR